MENQEQQEQEPVIIIIGQCQHCDQNFVKRNVGETHQDCPGTPTQE